MDTVSNQLVTLYHKRLHHSILMENPKFNFLTHVMLYLYVKYLIPNPLAVSSSDPAHTLNMVEHISKDMLHRMMQIMHLFSKNDQ